MTQKIRVVPSYSTCPDWSYNCQCRVKNLLRMARRVFFSFHFERDIWRANQVRNSNVVAGTDAAGFFDHSEYEEAQRRGRAAIARMILRHLEGTTVTVVLIGAETAFREWVRFEIEESVKRKNGFLGIHIHHLKDQHGLSSSRGPLPSVPEGVVFPTYDWDGDLDRFRREIEAAGKRADELRRAPPPFNPFGSPRW